MSNIFKKIYQDLRRVYRWLIPPPGAQFLNKCRMHAKYDIGDWTYGYLEVQEWSDGTTLKIGKFCSLAQGVTIVLGGEHRTDWVTTFPASPFFKSAKEIPDYSRSRGNVTIGSDVWIGRESMIMSGVNIGNGAVIGARSIVRKDVPPFAIVAGNPARVTGFRMEKDQIQALEKIAWWDWPLEKIEEAWPLLLASDVNAFIEKYR